MSLKDQMVAAMSPPSETVTINGVSVRMVGLGALDQLAMAEMQDGVDATFWVLERMIRDDDGARVFGDNDQALRSLDMKAVGELSDAAARLLSAGAQAKNSEAAR